MMTRVSFFLLASCCGQGQTSRLQAHFQADNLASPIGCHIDAT